MNDPLDFGSTTAVNKYAPGMAWIPRAIRDRLTPKAFLATVAGILSVLYLSINAWVTTQHNIKSLQDLVTKQQEHEEKVDKRLEDFAKDFAKGQADTTELLHRQGDELIRQGKEMDKQREWRETLATIASQPPRVRKRR